MANFIDNEKLQEEFDNTTEQQKEFWLEQVCKLLIRHHADSPITSETLNTDTMKPEYFKIGATKISKDEYNEIILKMNTEKRE